MNAHRMLPPPMAHRGGVQRYVRLDASGAGCVGRGSCGVVYLAKDALINADVAVKRPACDGPEAKRGRVSSAAVQILSECSSSEGEEESKDEPPAAPAAASEDEPRPAGEVQILSDGSEDSDAPPPPAPRLVPSSLHPA